MFTTKNEIICSSWRQTIILIKFFFLIIRLCSLFFSRHCRDVCWRWIRFNPWVSWKRQCRRKIQKGTYGEVSWSKCKYWLNVKIIMSIFIFPLYITLFLLAKNWIDPRKCFGWKDHYKVFWGISAFQSTVRAPL